MNIISSKITSNRSTLDSEMLELANFLGLVVGAGVMNAMERKVMTLDDLSDEAKRNIDSIDDIIDSKDLSLLLRIILDGWDVAFSKAFSDHDVTYQLVDKVRHVRNDFSHNTGDYGDDFYVADSLQAIRDLHSGIKSAMPAAPSAGHSAGTIPQASSIPNSADSFYNQGMVYLENGNWDLAIANFTSAININRNHADTYNRRGEAFSAKETSFAP